MKRILLIAAMLIAIPVFAFGQTNDKKADKKGGDEQALRQMLGELSAALGRNDAAALDRIYSDDYTFINDSGVLVTRAQRLAAVKSGDLKYESISFEDINVRMYGNSAVATFRVTSKFKAAGKDMGGQFRTTATFVKINGRWQDVAAQSTPIAAQ
jgi:ketosteroid isomerase-like protein